MTRSLDPRAVDLSIPVYRALLHVYPRRFRLQYRDEMAILFRDSCREAYRERGSLGLVPAWGRALMDLGSNAPGECVSERIEQSRAAVPISRSCSCCYSEVASEWKVCKICGTVLNDGTTHPSRPPHNEIDQLERLRRHFGGM